DAHVRDEPTLHDGRPGRLLHGVLALRGSADLHRGQGDQGSQGRESGEVTVAFVITLVALGLLGAFVAGLLGVGGAIIMIPLLLYGPPLLGVGQLDARSVTGITIAQVCVASVSGMLAHRRRRLVHADLALWGGLSMAVGSLAGALASNAVAARTLLLT